MERLLVYEESRFVISGYHNVKQYELVELLFFNYAINGVVVRRIFDRCVFDFLGFTRDQIDDVMLMLERRKKPSRVYYSFTRCRVLSDGVELDDCILRRDDTATEILNELPPEVKKAVTRKNIHYEYNLKEMTVFSESESPAFSQEIHERMVQRREMHKKLGKQRHDLRVAKRAKKAIQ